MYQQIWYYMEFIVSYSELLAVVWEWELYVKRKKQDRQIYPVPWSLFARNRALASYFGTGYIEINKIGPDGERSFLVDAVVNYNLSIAFGCDPEIQVGVDILQCHDNRLHLSYRSDGGNRLEDKILSGMSMPAGVALLDGCKVDINLNEMEKMQTILSYIELTDIQTKDDGVHIYGNYKTITLNNLDMKSNFAYGTISLGAGIDG